MGQTKELVVRTYRLEINPAAIFLKLDNGHKTMIKLFSLQQNCRLVYISLSYIYILQSMKLIKRLQQVSNHIKGSFFIHELIPNCLFIIGYTVKPSSTDNTEPCNNFTVKGNIFYKQGQESKWCFPEKCLMKLRNPWPSYILK